MPSTSLAVDRYVVAAAVVLTCVLFTAEAADPVNVIKLTALLLCTIALAATAAYRMVRHRIVLAPTGPAAYLAGAFFLSCLVAAVTAPTLGIAVIGAYGRNSGLLSYFGAVAVFLVGARVYRGRNAQVLVAGVVLAGMFTASYGLLQKLGIDSIPWNNPFNPIIAALGNPNFASAYMGVAASVAVGGALWRGWALGWRIAAGATAALCLFVPLLSEAVQGPIAGAAGLAVVAVGVLLGLSGPARKYGLLAVAVATVVAIATLMAGALLKAGPAVGFFTGISYDARLEYWKAATVMLREHPVAGVGLDHFGQFWRTARSREGVPLLGGDSYTDAAHNVPLQMFAQGGVLLGVAYLAFVLAVGWCLVRGLLRCSDDDRMLLSGLGGGWAAYQVQSLVSIDQVPLIVLHFALAGGVVAVAGGAHWREVRLPGALRPPEPVPASKRRRTPPPPKTRAVTGADKAALAALGLVAVVAAVQALAPLRANVALSRATAAQSAGAQARALPEINKAMDLVPNYPFHVLRKAQHYQQADRPRPAVANYLTVAELDPHDPNVLSAAASIEETEGNLEAARELYQRAARLDPLNRVTLMAVAEFELRHSGALAARELMLAATERIPTDAGLWATLGDAHFVLDDVEAARAAYQRSLDIDPGQGTAQDGMAAIAALEQAAG